MIICYYVMSEQSKPKKETAVLNMDTLEKIDKIIERAAIEYPICCDLIKAMNNRFYDEMDDRKCISLNGVNRAKQIRSRGLSRDIRCLYGYYRDFSLILTQRAKNFINWTGTEYVVNEKHYNDLFEAFDRFKQGKKIY